MNVVRKNIPSAVLFIMTVGLIIFLGVVLWREDRNDCFEYESKGVVAPFVSTVVVKGRLLACHDASNGTVDAIRCEEMKRCPPSLPSEEDRQ